MSAPVHGGDVRRLAAAARIPVEEFLDFSASINPLGPPPWTRTLLCRELDNLVHYPDIRAEALVQAAARRYACDPDCVIPGNGSSEILHALARTLAPEHGRALIPAPSYADYEISARTAGLDVVRLPLDPDRDFRPDLAQLDRSLDSGPALVFLGQPNNPTGSGFPARDLRELAVRRPESVFVVDEAFADFVTGPALSGLPDRLDRNRPSNVVLVLSLTKFYALPGLRLGLALADTPLAARIRAAIPAWSVNSLAQAFAARALDDTAWADRVRSEVALLANELHQALIALPGLKVYPGQANFRLCRLTSPGHTAPALAQTLLKRGIAIRVCANFPGLDERYFRVGVRTRDENTLLVRELAAILAPASAAARPVGPSRKRTPAIMFQGTTSSAGKSVLTAALCRVLLQDGLRPAPFKAQNMSLNSFVTPSGAEIGRAQATQAAACRLEPDARMNPVLLKPTTDVGSQVIVNGHPVGNMRVAEYIAYKPKARLAARAAYASLAAGADVMVLEGAGSPAEVNLRTHDIVNMDMAAYAGARVLLVADIDRGGAFAALVGTMECLSPDERRRVGGHILNRFRGDPGLLGEALDFTLARTGRPVLGIVPYLTELGLPEEDSVTFKESRGTTRTRELDIALIDLPHISNFTDADPLRQEPDVGLRIVRRAGDLGDPDAVIIPGSKNVLADLVWLRDSGLAGAVTRLAERGREIVGVCGGFQMIGRRIADPEAIESDRGQVEGLGLLDAVTVLRPDKLLTQAKGRHCASGLAIRGYEIHHGVTETGGATVPAVIADDGRIVGLAHPTTPVWGSYFHGVFDADAFRRHFLDSLRIRRGLSPLGRIMTAYDIEPALDRLAQAFRASIDLRAVYSLLGL